MDVNSETKAVKTKEYNGNSLKTPWLVYILTFIAQLSLINQGYDMGCSSGAILLVQDIKYFHLTQVWNQLITAGSLPSAAVASLIGAFISDSFGRKKCLMFACICYILGCVVSGSAYNRASLLIGRLLIGCGIGNLHPSHILVLMDVNSETKAGKTKEYNGNSLKTPWLVYILTFIAQLSLINQGHDMGSSSGVIRLFKDIEYLHLTQVWNQLITAGSLPSAAVASLIGAFISDSFGRKKCLMFACICYILGCVVSGSAYNRASLLIGRLLIGCGIGIACAATAVYVAECSPSHLRGRLIGLSQPFLTIGILFGTIISALFSYDKKNGWRYIWGIQALFSCTQFFALIFLPESPHWFIQKSRKDEATKALIGIRNTKDVGEEIQEIEANFNEIQESIAKLGGSNLLVKMLKTRSVRRALLVGCAIQLFAQFSGVNTVIFYSGIIIQMSGVGNVSSALWDSVIVNCFSLTFAIIGMWLVDSVGRRKLSIIGLLGLFFSSLCIGTTFLMEAIYSPRVNTTNDFLNDTCSTYSKCNDCVRDADCGFCYEDIRDVIDGDCLPVNDTSHLISEVGACNSSLSRSKYSMKWAYDYCPVSFSWVAIVGLSLYLMFYAPGMGPLPWTINAEIYPLWARSTGSALGSMTAWICNLIIAVSFLSFVELIRSYGVFYVMASVALIGSIFCFFFLPETKNKSLEEIEKLFLPKKPNV